MSRSTDDKRSAAAAGKPTLEELLRLKRAERPDAAFWEDFERGLRQKQLAAIIEPKPWWLGFVLAGRRIAPIGLPLSAAAAAALAFVALRDQPALAPDAGPGDALRSPAELVAHIEIPDSAALPPSSVPSVPEAARLAGIEPSPVLAQAPARSDEPAAFPAIVPDVPAGALLASAPAVDPAGESVLIPVVDALLELGSASISPTASERTITENLAALRLETPELVANASSLALDAPDGPIEDSLEPALKMEVRNPRHARVLLAMADNPSAETPGRLPSLRERYAHGLDREDSLSGSASRLGVGGDRFSVSF